MKNPRTRLILILGLALVLAVIAILPSLSATPAPNVTPSPTRPISSPVAPASPTPNGSNGTPTSVAATIWDVSKLPTVTPPAPGEPTLPPEAQAMHAAPTATPGSPPLPSSATPTVTPFPTPLSVLPNGSDDTPMIEIPAGEFIMGSTAQEVEQFNKAWNDKYGTFIGVDPFLNEAPQLTVDLDTYSIDHYKVTNAHYRQCVGSGECSSPPKNLSTLAEYFANPHYNDYPAQVTWDDAYTYCQWVGKRLPSEAEWEKAARGTDGRLYPWGNVPDLTRYSNNPDRYEPVNQYPQGASPYGVVGMLDRPSEWTIDEYVPYPGNAIVYPDRDTSNGELENAYGRGYRVVRGGGYLDERARVSYRQFAIPQSNYSSFRCARGPVPASIEQAVVRSTVPTPVPTLMPISEVDLSNMVYIPAGEFVMGTNESSGNFDMSDATPQHVVYLHAFYMDRTEITVQEYVVFLNKLGTQHHACSEFDCGGAGGMVFDPNTNRYIVIDRYDETIGKWVEGTRYSKYPIVEVSWYGAQAYCAWLGKRLPTEAEWEKAARGTDGRKYPWGNEPIENFFQTLRHEVGNQPGNASPYGVLDMAGNAREWTADWYRADYYSHSPYSDPPGPSSGKYKVIRGAGQRLGVQVRTPYLPDQTYEAGFRCVYTMSPHQ